MIRLITLCIAIIALAGTACLAGTVVVAPSDASPQVKAKADLVCDGKDDQTELNKSLEMADSFVARYSGPPDKDPEHAAKGRHEVIWQAGTYHLSGTVVIPGMADSAIRAEGTYFYYEPKEGDAVVVTGMLRCRFNFGTIDTHSTGDAIKIKSGEMSIVTFTGLVGHGAKGIGLHLVGSCTNRYEGTDIGWFDTGILVDDVSPKTDTNWFWVSYIKQCNTCVWEKGKNVDSNCFYVNVDATLPGSVAVRTAAALGYWHIIMGTYKYEGKNKAIILDPGARENVMFCMPPIGNFAWEDNSGNSTNAIISSPQLRGLIDSLRAAPPAK